MTPNAWPHARAYCLSHYNLPRSTSKADWMVGWAEIDDRHEGGAMRGVGHIPLQFLVTYRAKNME